MKRLPLQFAVIFLMNVTAAFPQSSRLGESCDLRAFGATDVKSFLEFDRELRSAMSKQDAVAVAFLVKHPLRINDDRGSFYLSDAASLQSRFQEVFPSRVRTAILKQPVEALFCNSGGIMYGNGVVWVNLTGKRYAIETINGLGSSPATGKIQFICDTDKERIVVDIGTLGEPRYRTWKKPRALTDKPDLEIPKGDQHFEGTGPCAHSTWTFMSGATKFVAEEVGCYASSDAPPEGARGTLGVSIRDNPQISSWCF
jgi:hypothetical protein